MNTIKPRLWQSKALYDINACTDNRIMLQAPTGSGKAFLIMFIAQQYINAGKAVLLLVDRIKLVEQLSESAEKFGIKYKIIQGDNKPTHDTSLTIASIQTYFKLDTCYTQQYELVIVDECHSIYKDLNTLLAIPDFIPMAIGVTATPYSPGLSDIYSTLITTQTAHDMTNQGILVPFEVFEMRKIDMHGAKVVAGEWTGKEVYERSNKCHIYDDVVNTYRNMSGMRGLVFCANLKHCEAVERAFARDGVSVAIYSSAQNEKQRADIMQKFDNKEIMLLITVATLSKGFDRGYIEVIFDIRPLRKSINEYIQILGRGLRTCDNKTLCMVIDFSGNWKRFKTMFNQAYFHGAESLLKTIDNDRSIAKSKQVKSQVQPKQVTKQPNMLQKLVRWFKI